ncbi:hypothetical protein BYT27DRAFT_7216416 [Phlegmacium glaucopus]|nr:hypothetical protein BYT27DRAFT_7216416 [Phlegmacium glaucopus]
MEEDTVAATARDTVNTQLEYMNDEPKVLMDHFRTTVNEEVTNQTAVMSSAVKALEVRFNQLTPYRDAVLSSTKVPDGVDLRIVTRVGIRACQFIIDFPRDSATQGTSQADMLVRFNKAMVKAKGEGPVEWRKVRMVENLSNRGFLGKFLLDKGTKWLTKQSHADTFITALGDEGVGTSLKKRNHPVIAHYVPLNLDTESWEHLEDIAEVNNLQKGDVLGIR